MVKEATIEKSDDATDVPVVYELGYHLLPAIAEDKVSNEVSVIKTLIEKNSGIFIAEEFPKLLQLAYIISRTEEGKRQKFKNAYFGWIKFEIAAENIATIKEALDDNENVLRFLLIKTVRESTLAPKKVFFEKHEKEKLKETPKVPLKPVVRQEKSKHTISDEELDKTIEELVAE